MQIRQSGNPWGKMELHGSLKTSTMAVGVDIIDMRRIARLVSHFGLHFLKYVYGPNEIKSCAFDVHYLAQVFAIKEAVAKALGIGFAFLAESGVLPTDIEIAPSFSGVYTVRLHQFAQQCAADLELSQWAVEALCVNDYAMAFAIAAPADVPIATLDYSVASVCRQAADILLCADHCKGVFLHDETRFSTTLG
jgi:holo-[acyl-carrier protein] synthase